MDLNATLFGQMITFAIFVWATVKYVWPPLMKAMEDRRAKIADGLAAAEQGKKELELAEIKSKEQLMEAKAQAATIIEQAHMRANHIVEEAKGTARKEGERLIELAKSEIEQEYNATRQLLLKQVSNLAVAGAQKILHREIDKSGHDNIVDNLVNEI